MAIQLIQFHTLTHDTQPKPPLSTTTTNHHRLSSLQVNAVSGKAQQLLQSGTVRPIRPKDAASAMESEGYILLDIRPEWEREKARVKGSLHVPLFVKDMDNSLLTLLKKWVHFGYIGLWTGQNFTMINPEFVEKVEMEVPDKDTKLLVACGGYGNLGWLAGGFNRAGEDDFPNVEGTEKLQYATIGGVSYYFLQLLVLLQAVGNKA
ncbi:hypothetical protein TEA_001152 [Camellia sinensis var. sinensis]|uniref:Rhodanese domain-containing protein n=1 Tax=Camellia sinensis var. sinensis TaxID=542762 RepID=A0A4S4DZV9_CAMSN|nr:hypothetical protein TEA_001152 [Camellia sinensis var. sinensis]